MNYNYSLTEIAKIGALYLDGEVYENIMSDAARAYQHTDDLEYSELPFNAIKRILLLTERLDSERGINAVIWGIRPDDVQKVEVIIAGSQLPREGYDIIPIWPELQRAFDGSCTRMVRSHGETVYIPFRNSLEEIVGVLEISRYKNSGKFHI